MKEPKNIIMTEHLKVIQYDNVLDITNKRSLKQIIIRKEAVTSIEDKGDRIVIELTSGKEIGLDRDIDVWVTLIEWIRDN